MRKKIALAALAGCVLTGLAVGEGAAPKVVMPDALSWSGPPNNPSLQGAWMLGEEKSPGPYILRVKLAKDGKIQPHSHPDERNSTVLSGTLYVGFGKQFDATKVIAIPEGGIYVAPANIAHYVWARDGAVVYQEAGVGPTGTSYAAR